MFITGIHLLHDSFPTRDHYPFSLDILNRTDSIRFAGPVSFFIGENGTGKTTLLKAVARHCSIHIWEEGDRRRYHHNPYEEELARFIRVDTMRGEIRGSFFSSEIFRHFAGILDEWAAADPGSLDYFGSESLVEKSHGQSHMAFFTHRFARDGVYFLDEPENALSPRRQIELLGLFRQFAATGKAQFIIATHSPILLAYPGAQIFSFDRIPIQEVAYEDTEYYRVYRDFLNHRENYLDRI